MENVSEQVIDFISREQNPLFITIEEAQVKLDPDLDIKMEPTELIEEPAIGEPINPGLPEPKLTDLEMRAAIESILSSMTGVVKPGPEPLKVPLFIKPEDTGFFVELAQHAELILKEEEVEEDP